MTGNDRYSVTRQNSMRYVIRIFANTLLQHIDVLGGYAINGICGVGSNGFVMKAIDERNTPFATVALKLQNVSYFIKHFYSFKGDDYHAFAFDHLEEIEKSLSNLAIICIQEYSNFEDDLGLAERLAYQREFYALSRIPRNDKVTFLVDHGFQKIHISDGCRSSTYIFPYLVMPYFSGIPLTDYADSCKFNIGKTIDISVKMAELIDFIHKCGVVHRDLYPNNFLYDEEDSSVKLIDFGSALTVGKKDMDVPGERRGARRFMSPEQFVDATVCDEVSDVFFLGANMFYLYSGDTPFDRTRDGDTSPTDIHDIINCPKDTKLSLFLSMINKMIRHERSQRLSDINTIKTAIIHLRNLYQ